MSVSESEQETEVLNNLLDIIRRNAKNRWPDAKKLGVPLNPDSNGWHWILGSDNKLRLEWWVSESKKWDDFISPCELMEEGYIAPCDLPYETAATLNWFLNRANEGEHVVLDWDEATDAIDEIFIQKKHADARALSRTYIPREGE